MKVSEPCVTAVLLKFYKSVYILPEFLHRLGFMTEARIPCIASLKIRLPLRVKPFPFPAR